MDTRPGLTTWTVARAQGTVPAPFSGRRPLRAGPGLASDEGGSVMAFAAISVFVLAAFMAMTFNMGNVVAVRMEMQNAADGAAYSAAQVKANSMNSVAWIGDGMAVVYYWCMRYAIDTIHLGVLAELAQHPRGGSPHPKFLIVGIDNATMRYNAARMIAQTGIARGELLLNKLSKMARGIASATPVLMRKEAYRIAKLNGAQGAVVFGAGQGLRRFTGKYAYFEDDKPSRFLKDYTVRVVGKGEMADWFDPERGSTRNPKDYRQTRNCWIPYVKLLSWNYDQHQKPFEAWLKALGTGNPVAIAAATAAKIAADLACPVCHGKGHGGAGIYRVRMYQQDIRNRGGQSINLKRFSMPLILKQDAFDPVHVGVWFPQTDSLLFFADPDFGYFAFASAQVGFLRSDGRIDISNRNLGSFARSDHNLHLVNFAARMIPEKDKYTGRLSPKMLLDLQMASWANPANGNRDGRIAGLFRKAYGFFGR